MDTQMMEHLRAKLLSRRDISLDRQTRLLAQQDQLLNRGATECKDPANERIEAARLKGLAMVETHALDRIDASLERMTKGTYGQCVHCRAAIETERLRAMPDINCCSGCTR